MGEGGVGKRQVERKVHFIFYSWFETGCLKNMSLYAK